MRVRIALFAHWSLYHIPPPLATFFHAEFSHFRQFPKADILKRQSTETGAAAGKPRGSALLFSRRPLWRARALSNLGALFEGAGWAALSHRLRKLKPRAIKQSAYATPSAPTGHLPQRGRQGLSRLPHHGRYAVFCVVPVVAAVLGHVRLVLNVIVSRGVCKIGIAGRID